MHSCAGTGGGGGTGGHQQRSPARPPGVAATAANSPCHPHGAGSTSAQRNVLSMDPHGTRGRLSRAARGDSDDGQAPAAGRQRRALYGSSDAGRDARPPPAVPPPSAATNTPTGGGECATSPVGSDAGELCTPAGRFAAGSRASSSIMSRDGASLAELAALADEQAEEACTGGSGSSSSSSGSDAGVGLPMRQQPGPREWGTRQGVTGRHAHPLQGSQLGQQRRHRLQQQQLSASSSAAGSPRYMLSLLHSNAATPHPTPEDSAHTAGGRSPSMTAGVGAFSRPTLYHTWAGSAAALALGGGGSEGADGHSGGGWLEEGDEALAFEGWGCGCCDCSGAASRLDSPTPPEMRGCGSLDCCWRQCEHSSGDAPAALEAVAPPLGRTPTMSELVCRSSGGSGELSSPLGSGGGDHPSALRRVQLLGGGENGATANGSMPDSPVDLGHGLVAAAAAAGCWPPNTARVGSMGWEQWRSELAAAGVAVVVPEAAAAHSGGGSAAAVDEMAAAAALWQALPSNGILHDAACAAVGGAAVLAHVHVPAVPLIVDSCISSGSSTPTVMAGGGKPQRGEFKEEPERLVCWGCVAARAPRWPG